MKHKKRALSMIGFFMLLLSGMSALAQFTLTSPTASTNWELGKTYSITWTSAMGAPATFNIILNYTDGGIGISSGIGTNVITAAGSFSFTVPSNFDTGYYYTVCLQDSLEQEYTCSPTFSIIPASGSTGGIATAPGATEILVYPMPLTEASVLQFSLTEIVPVNILVTDMAGREIKQLNHHPVSSGKQSIPLALACKSGLYLLHLQTTRKLTTYKILVP